MVAKINLERYFNPEALTQAFHHLEEAKTDKYTGEIRIPMGADGIKYEDFEKNLKRNVKDISRIVLSGKYLFYPLREVKIPKDENDKLRGERPLRIARIRDVLVQKQLYNALYEVTEHLFARPKYDNVSTAYRKGKSVHTAIRGIWNYKIDGYKWALDADIKSFFDEINHDRLLELIDNLVGNESISGKLLWRYTRTPYVPYETYKHLSYRKREKFFMKKKPQIPSDQLSGERKGIPQGGVLSGMLANLYLHEFDTWMMDELKDQYKIRYFRYADDFVMLAKNQQTVQNLAPKVEEKLQELHLEMHPLGGEKSKTRLVHIPEDNLNFLGFQITRNYIRVRPKNIKKFKGSFRTSIKRIGTHDTINEEQLIAEIVKYYANSKLLGPLDDCEICEKPKKRYNWISFFAPVITDMKQLHDLDIWIRKHLNEIMFRQYDIAIRNRKHLIKIHNLQTLIGEYRRYKRKNFCNCNVDAQAPDEITEVNNGDTNEELGIANGS